MNNFVIEAFNLEEYKEIQDHYNYKFFNYNKLPYGDTTCISISTKDDPKYGSHEFYLKNNEFGKIITFEEWKKSVYKPKENNIKYVVETSTESEYNTVNNYAGNTLTSKFSSTYGKDTCISVSNNKAGGYANKSFYTDNPKNYGPVLSFKDWSLMFDIKPLKPNKTLKLTSDYSAEVNYNTKIVQVGCQSIPFSKVEELAKLIKE